MADEPAGRHRPPTGDEVEFQPGSRGLVLLNKVGITGKRAMDLAEYNALLATQLRYLSVIGPQTRFTAALIRQMHRDWLGDLYAWAGEYRTVNLTKGGSTWPPAMRVPDNMMNFENGLLREHTPCRPEPLQTVAERLAIVHAELLLIHPFREGNGRLARWLAELMAYQAGLPRPVYRFAGTNSKGRFEKYVAAVRSGYWQDYDALTAFFVEALETGLEREGRA